MIDIQRAQDRYSADHGWLKSNFSFSFADYQDENNMQFGPLRVLNDDTIAPAKGFGMHPHREMEIVTLVLSGSLQHKDSLGNVAETTWGGIQRMSAGTGVFHSEFNVSPTESLELLQMWFMPAARGVAPSYETTAFDTGALGGGWLPIVSHESVPGKVAHVHQDMTIYLTEQAAGQSIAYEQPTGRKMFLFVLDGEVTLNDGEATLRRRDAAKLTGERKLTAAATVDSRLMLIDLP